MTTNHIEQAVYNAMQAADELGGPDAVEYIAMMTRIAAEASQRAMNATEHVIEKARETPAAPVAKFKTVTFELTEDAEGKPVYAFDFQDMLINDAFHSECSRFEVNPEEHYGISQAQAYELRRMNRTLRVTEVLQWCHEHINANAFEQETGGGCTAIQVARDDGSYWLITVRDDAGVPESTTEPVSVGLYSGDSEHWAVFDCADMAAAARLIESCKHTQL